MPFVRAIGATERRALGLLNREVIEIRVNEHGRLVGCQGGSVSSVIGGRRTVGHEIRRSLDERGACSAGGAPQGRRRPTRRLTHARILQGADLKTHGLDDDHIAEVLEISARTVARVRQRYVLEGLNAALDHLRPQRLGPRKLDERGEAHLIALS